MSLALLRTKPADVTGFAPGFVRSPGTATNRLWVADTAAFDLTGDDLDVRWYGSMDSYTQAAAQSPFSQWGTTGNQRAWLIRFTTSGVQLQISTDGTAVTSSTAVPVPVTGTFPIGVRFTRVRSTGVTTLYFSYDGILWDTGTSVGTLAAGSSIFNSTAQLSIAGGWENGTGEPPRGRTYWAELRDAIAAPVPVLSFNGTTDITNVGASTLTTASGHTATVVGAYSPPLRLFRSTPAHDNGMPLGTPDDDWRFTVEMALPEANAALYGQAVYGEASYSTEDWYDLTPWCRGLRWQRGSDDPGQRPVTGDAEVTLDNRTGRWSPWDTDDPEAFYRSPGSLLRWSCWTEHYFVAQMTGVVESWVEVTEGLGHESVVSITLMETVGLLGTVNANAVSSQGADDTPGERCVRLLENVDWTLGFYDETGSTVPLQATTMSANRLSELHQTADSADAWFRSHRSGIPMLEVCDPMDRPSSDVPNTARYGTAVYGTAVYATTAGIDQATWRAGSYFFSDFELRPDAAVMSAPDANGQVRFGMVYDADSLEPLNDADVVENDVRLARTGGTQQVAIDAFSRGRYGVKSYARSDLLNTSDADVLAIAQARRDRGGRRVLRIGHVDVFGRPENLHGLLAIDLGDEVCVRLPSNDGVCVMGHVIGMEHSVTPKSTTGPLWRSTLALETRPGFLYDETGHVVTVAATTTVTDVL